MKQLNFVGKLSLIGILCFFCAVQLSFAQGKATKQVKAQVKGSYWNFEKAVRDKEGEIAVLCLDSKSIAYYDSMVNLIKTADSSQVAALPFSEMLCVLNFRQLYLTNQIELDIANLDGTSFYVSSVNLGLTNPPKWTLGDISCHGNSAQAQCMDGKTVLPISLDFNMERGLWRIDITTIMEFVNNVMSELCSKSDRTVKDLIVKSLSGNFGELHTDVWKPLIKQ
ncbi:MAG: hypothetical protein MJ198_02355 [Bacteroidales bacterium]|nr:hypothetical protein [Bacteroidales bacterium]